MKIIIGLVLCIPFLGWAGVRVIKDIHFKQDCGGYLKRAADANTIELAKTELSRSLKYIEGRGLTNGYTSIVYKTPDEDMGFWHSNLTSSLKELNELREDSSPLEKSNMLMKLRETLLDSGKEGQHLTVPDGISLYPNNVSYAIVGWITFLIALIGAFFILIGLDEWL